jgi:hypothetical protein
MEFFLLIMTYDIQIKGNILKVLSVYFQVYMMLLNVSRIDYGGELLNI